MNELREIVNKYLTKVRTSPQLRLHALEEIFILADNDSYKEPLCDPSLNLLPILRDLLYENIGQMEVCDPVIRILWFLSRNLACCVIMSSSKLGILSVLIKILTEVANIRQSNYFEGIMNVFTNMSLTADCQYELVSSELGFVSYLRSYILAYHHDLRAIAILSNILLLAKSETVPAVLYTNVMNILMDRLARGGVDPTIWHQRYIGMTSWCLSFLTNLSHFPISHDVIRNLDQFTFFYTLSRTVT
eukprot:gene15381-17209_t